MKPTSTVKQPLTQSQARNALQELLYQHWLLLNSCHLCHKLAGKHKKMDRATLKESEFVTTLYKCGHGLKVCQECIHNDIRVRKLSKKEKKAQKKERVKQLKALRNEGLLQQVSPP